VQVDPIKPKLKPPGTKRLNLKLDMLLSSSAFKFSWRRYNESEVTEAEQERRADRMPPAGAYTRSRYSST